MDTPLLPTLDQHFRDLTDPRVDRTKLHKLVDILVIAICAVIARADNGEDVAAFGEAKRDWFQTFLDLPNGIPSHDTFTRVFARLNPEQFQTGFVRWMTAVCARLGGQVIAIDGKVLRRSHDHGIGQAAIDMVSAWATANRLVLGQVKVTEKSNEITAIPRLLEALEISGCIVTIDAMGCQTDIAQTIVDHDADYVLGLKDNQGQLSEDVQLLFNDLEGSQYRAYAFDYTKTVDKDPGRLEIRECWTISDPTVLSHLRGFERGPHLQTVARIRAPRRLEGETSCEDRYHITTLTGAARVLSAVRAHWGIENELHWTLDIAFDEDRCRVRKDHGPENLALLRHLALNLLKHEKTCKRSIKGKRLLAGWKNDYLFKVLAGLANLSN